MIYSLPPPEVEVNRFVLLMAFFVIMSFQSVHASVWQSENQWDAQWEDTFSAWVEKDWTTDIFTREGSPVFGVKTDCADATYTMRMLFSYLNKLPFKINNPLGFSNYITNEVSQFDLIENEHDRFIAFVNFVNEATDSASLATDTYPIEITREAFRPGVVFVSPNVHTYQLKKLNENGIPVMYSSTTPASVRNLYEVNSFPFYLPRDFKKFRDGFRVFKKPQDYGVLESKLPHYGIDQFEIAKMHGEDQLAFGDSLAKKLELRPETLDEKLQRSSQNLCNAVQSRALFVASTEKLKAEQGNQCLSAVDYDNESTPRRDHRIELMYAYMKSLTAMPGFETSRSVYAPTVRAIFGSGPGDEFNTLSWCPINRTLLLSQIVTLKMIYHSIQTQRFVSDPNANLEARWGLEEYQPVCPQY